MENKSIVILCAGGPAPGMNTVIGSVSKSFLAEGYTVLGMNYGYKTLFTDNPNFIKVNYQLADRIFDKGGSYLKMSRYKPKDNEFNTTFFEKHNVKLLVTVGGDDTASTANRISQYFERNNINIQNIHVPKTIDNDIPLPENLPTFGFITAKNEGSRICKTIYEDARTSDGWFVVSAMGRQAGHLALGIGVSCQYPMIVLPEMFNKTKITFDKIIKLIISSIIKRKMLNADYGVAVVSEGVFHFIDEDQLKNSGIKFTYDDHGHPELGNVSKAHIFNILLQDELKRLKLNFKSRPVEVGYETRCVNPISFDLDYCTKLGYGVKALFDKGESQCIVIVKHDNTVKALKMSEITGEDGKVTPRMVDIESEMFKLSMDNLEYIMERDYEEAKKYVSNPEDYNLKNILNW